MGTIITVLSNRGGVGKSTVTGNLAVALGKIGEKVLVVEGDLGATSLNVVLGVSSRVDDFREILEGRAYIGDAIVDNAYPNLHILPNKMKLKNLYEADMFKFVDVIKDLAKDYDLTIVDGPAGLGKDALVTMKAADEIIVVTTPEPHSIKAALQLKHLTTALGLAIKGVIVNRVPLHMGLGFLKQIEVYFEVPILGVILNDDQASKCITKRRPIVQEYPKNPVSKEITAIAHRLVGLEYVQEEGARMVPTRSYRPRDGEPNEKKGGMFGFLKK